MHGLIFIQILCIYLQVYILTIQPLEDMVDTVQSLSLNIATISVPSLACSEILPKIEQSAILHSLTFWQAQNALAYSDLFFHWMSSVITDKYFVLLRLIYVYFLE